MVCGHGSRDPRAIAEFNAFAAKVRAALPDHPVDWGYLEFARPVIRDGLDRLRAAGVRQVLAVPGMLFAAGHTKNDIPSVLRTYEAEHPEMTIRYGRDLAIDTRMVRAAGERIAEALAAAPECPGAEPTHPHQTLLMVVGRGTSDPDANSDVAKMMRLLWEGFGFGWGETAYSGVTFPLVEPALEHAARLGYRRIIVFPYFLFTGVLVQRIYDHTDRVAARHPDIEFVKAPYLNDHPLVLATIVDRVAEILDGRNLMNCQLCKYRELVLGFEAERGLAQRSHHHHVEGVGLLGSAAAPAEQPGHHHHEHGHHKHDHADEHGHGHVHGHADPADHHHHDPGHHHPYPHADHPWGPSSLAVKTV